LQSIGLKLLILDWLKNIFLGNSGLKYQFIDALVGGVSVRFKK
jgi:hypothetical protein